MCSVEGVGSREKPLGKERRLVASDWCTNSGSCSNNCARLAVYVTNQLPSPTATIAMEGTQSAVTDAIRRALCSAPKISDENYEQSFAFSRFWLDIEQTYRRIPSDLALDVVLSKRGMGTINTGRGELIHPTAHLFLRFTSNAESDLIFVPYNAGLQSCICTRILQDFFCGNLRSVQAVDPNYWRSFPEAFYTNTNLIAHLANLGHLEEVVIHNHILQSLISHPKLYDHQADALVILFKLAGATFEACADPSVVDRCFELLKGHYSGDLARGVHESMRPGYLAKGNLVKVSVLTW
jgi:hypothetical protein